jgi:glutamate-1-semialdehyde 2,1-aminomutase
MTEKWETSRALLRRAKKSLAGGVSSPFRAKFPVPLYFRDGCGSRLEDVDGNRYIDYTLAWGPLILGHRHPRLVEALRAQAERPHTYGAEHDLEYLVAEKVQELVPCAARVAFTSSGSEAVQLAIRLARAYTGRALILKFEGHYHGWMDSVLLSHHPAADQVGAPDCPNVVPESRGQVSNAVENVLVAGWNSLESAERLFREQGGRIAAVIMEPVLCNSGCLMPEPGYFEGIRALCREYGALLVFDEVITGFRMSLGGAQGWFRITPDLATFGKAMAGGLALSAVAGKKEILELIFGGGVSFGGTFNGNPLSLAASRTCLEVLSAGAGAALAQANCMGEKLMEGIRDIARAHRVPLLVSGFGTAFALHFTNKGRLQNYRDTLEDDRELLSRFLLLALQEGIYALPDGRFYVSTVHDAQDVGVTLEALDRVFRQLS